METVRIYRLTGLRPGFRARLRAAQMEAAQVWTLCRGMHLSARHNRTLWPTQDDFQQATKGRFALHSQTVQAIFRTFLGTIDATRELRKTNPKIRYPWKDKRYYPLLWPAQAVSRERGRVVLPMGRGRPSLVFRVSLYVETVLIPKYTRGDKRKESPVYRKLMNRAFILFKKGQVKEAQRLRRQAQRLPTQILDDPNYRRLRYCRYADDFLLGFIGPKAEAEEIKQQIGAFLRDELKLELSNAKTLITHARSEAARFLGYHITILQENTKQSLNPHQGTKRRSINGRVGLKVSPDVIKDKCRRYQQKGKVVQRAELLNESDYTIVMTHQLEYRGIANYYRMAFNMHTLDRLKWVMEQALTKTLANKHKTSVTKVYARYKTDLQRDEKTYKGLQVTVLREGKAPLVATWGGIPLTWDIQATLEDRPQQLWGKRTELEQRLLAQLCELCGATRLTDRIEVHHIRALKDLNCYTGREKPSWVRIMAARRRKTLVLCRTCHMDIQYGRPVRRQKSSA